MEKPIQQMLITLLWSLLGFVWMLSPLMCVKGNRCEETYKFLNESDRSILINSNVDSCDASDLDEQWGWFRVSGDAGNALASSLPPSGTCNGGTRAYLEDDHPSYGVGDLTLTLCMATRNNNCLTRKSLTVVNCGEFYLYNLFRIRSCGSNGWRYCTNGIADDKCSGDKCPNGKLCVLKDNGKQSECVDAPPSGTQSPIIPPSGDPCSSNPCSHGGTCNNNSNTYTCSCMFGYSGDNCDINSYEDCTNALGIQSGAIPDISLSASSTWNSYTGASLARLNLTERGNYSGGWVAGVQALSQYLQIVFSATEIVLTGIATQGREGANQWVKSYFLIYKNSNWHNYKETRGIAYTVFQGNTDRNGIVRHKLSPIIKAHTFRFVVLEWHNIIAMRVELYGCSGNQRFKLLFPLSSSRTINSCQFPIST